MKKKLATICITMALVITSCPLTAAALPQDEGAVSGTVKLYGFDKSESSASAKSGVKVSLTLKDGEKASVTSGDDGSFSYEVDEAKRTDDGKYTYEVSADPEHLDASGTLTAGEETDILIRERYEASDSDYALAEQEGVEDGCIKEAGTYTITGKDGKKLATSLDGEQKDSIDVEIDEGGNIAPFYVYNDGTCSKEYSDGTVPIDSEGPVITDVTTRPASDGTYVKEHGIYSKVKAEIIVKATITDKGSDIDEIYLIGKKDGEETRYDVTKVSGQDGEYKAEIGLPSEQTILDAETMYIVAVDKLGNKTEKLIAKNEEASSVTLEEVPPELSYSLSAEPNENGWYKESPEVTVKAKDEDSGLSAVTVYQNGDKLDELEVTEKETAEKTLTVKSDVSSPSSDGSYKIRITAEDNSGNEAEEEFALKIDEETPSVSFAGAEDEENYKNAPSVTVKEDERYSSEAENMISATVYKNGSSDGKEYTKKAGDSLDIPSSVFSGDGSYLIEAYAVDAAGNRSSKEILTFIKDSTPPELSAAPTSSPNKNGWYKSLPSISASASDSLSGLRHFSIKEDGEVLTEKTYDSIEKLIQTLEKKARIDKASDDGSYNFTVVAEDNAGNSTEKKMKLYIDLVTPKVSQEGVTAGTHYRKVPDIKIGNDEKYYKADGAFIHYEIKRDGDEVASVDADQKRTVTLLEKYFKKDGKYTFTAYAEDAAGNRSDKIKVSFVKDSTAPVLTLSGASNGKFYSKPQTITLKVVERFFETDNVKVSAVRKLGDGTHNEGFPWKNEGKTSTSSKKFTSTGTYTITASAVDKAGNKSGTKKLTFTVDTKAPVITITGVTDGGIYTYGQGLAPKADVKDDYLDSKSITFTKAGQPVSSPSFEQIKENDGIYTMTVTARDKAGNTARKEISFVVNRFGSYFEYNDAIKALMGQAVQNVDSDLVITEKNVSKIIRSDARIYRDGKEIGTKGETTGKEDTPEKVYRHIFKAADFEDEGSYEINVVSKDEAGNEMESAEENGQVRFFVDRTAPVISLSGIDPKGNKTESVKVNIDAKDTLTGISSLKATVNGEEVRITEDKDSGECYFEIGKGLRQKVSVTATDGAGNSAEANETASVSTNALSLFVNRFLWPIVAVIGAGLAGLLFFLIGKRRKDDDEEEEEAEAE